MTTRAFGRYKVSDEVGRGAMGVVYRGVDPMIGRTVAIKAINVSYLDSVGVRTEEYLERFQREAQVAGRLSHPAIVKIYDLGPTYLVMEFVEGQSLASLLQAKTRWPLSKIIQMLGEAADALDYAHGQGIVHRDVKPANVMLQPDGSVKVMDFGLARVESSTLTAAGEILGSASYMAPEVVLGRTATPRSDIFSLAVVIYELMTGDRPFGGGSVSAIIHNIVREPPRATGDLALNLPPAYDAIFAQALAKDPAVRYTTASEFAGALAAAQWADRDPMLPDPRELAHPTPVDPGATLPPKGREVRARPEEIAKEESPLAKLVSDPIDGAATVRAIPPVGLQEDSMAEKKDEDESKLPATVILKPEPTASRVPATVILKPGAVDPDATAAARPAPAPAATPPPPAPPPPPAVDTGRTGPIPVVAPPAAKTKGSGLWMALAVVALLVLVLLAGLAFVAYRYLTGPGVATAIPASETPPTTLAMPPPPTQPPAAEAVAPTETPAEAVTEPAPVPEPAAVASTQPPPVAAAPAIVMVTSDPSGARILVGKRERGRTPFRLTLPAGKAAITIEMEGFKPWRRDLRLAAGKQETLEARLEANPREAPPAPIATPPPVRAGDLVPLTSEVKPPKKVSGEGAQLPSSIRNKKLAASVLVEFVVDENGGVRDPKVVESGGDAIDGACLDAVKKWRYEPATLRGVKVKVPQKARFTFQSR